MATKPRSFDENLYYHIYNCGVEKRIIFQNPSDYVRFLRTMEFYLHKQRISYAQFQELIPQAKTSYNNLNPKGLGSKLVKIISFCLMPNHFHIVAQPAKEKGITKFISDITNSYTRYFNIKNDRIGSLFQGTFKAKEIASEESLLQVTRYVHLNPVMSYRLNVDGLLLPEEYSFSSYRSWLGLDPKGLESEILDREEIDHWKSAANGTNAYKEFVESKIKANPAVGVEDLILE